MQSVELRWTREGGLRLARACESLLPHLVLFFASAQVLEDGAAFAALKDRFPTAQIIGAAGAGQFARSSCGPHELVGVAVEFSRAYTRLASAPIATIAHSEACGRALGRSLAKPDLKAVFLLCEGVDVDAEKLGKGLRAHLGDDIEITGGVSGNAFSGEKAAILIGEEVRSGHVAAIGFYGDSLNVRAACGKGWTAIGVRKTITRSSGALVYELGGEPALDIYERYLCEDDRADSSPATSIVPFRLIDPHSSADDIIRMVVGIDEKARALRFAGEMPQGWAAQLVRASIHDLSAEAARAVDFCESGTGEEEALTIIVSCIGRKLLMGQRIIDEIDAIAARTMPNSAIAGFYSFGEFARGHDNRALMLQNHTITVMSVREKQEQACASPV